MPDRGYTVDQRIEAGNALDRLDVPVIQVGFPAVGEDEHEIVGELAAQCVTDVVAIARGVESDVDAALDAGANAIEVFVSVSDLHWHTSSTSRARLVFGAATGRGAAWKLLTCASRDPTDELIERLLDRSEQEGPLDLDRELSLAAEC